MIDLHSHILPRLDDGSPDLATSLAMARLAVADGVKIMACTPHIKAGVYDHTGRGIATAMKTLQLELNRQQIELQLVAGADIHIAPDLEVHLKSGRFPTLNRSRYFLFEPPHHVVPPRIEELAARLINAGFVPIVTHPERLTWVESHYRIIEHLHEIGCLMQITAGALAGGFGKAAKAIAERMADEGRVDIIASDAHNTGSRAPGLSEGLEILARRIGEADARLTVLERPLAIIRNEAIAQPAKRSRPAPATDGLLKRILGRMKS